MCYHKEEGHRAEDFVEVLRNIQNGHLSRKVSLMLLLNGGRLKHESKKSNIFHTNKEILASLHQVGKWQDTKIHAREKEERKSIYKPGYIFNSNSTRLLKLQAIKFVGTQIFSG